MSESESRRTGQVWVNVGVLGHVDSGKTSLCKVLSTTASTAAFDSNPQSKERGITLDLGFSSFSLSDKFNVTLVDCPGHASLIRTVLGGVQIMDLMILVIDVSKGMQPQSWECLILANITAPYLIVVLNKVDMLDSKVREEKVTKFKRLMKGVLNKTRFGEAPIVVVSAMDNSIGTTDLTTLMLEKLNTLQLKRDVKSPFVVAVDHCFSIKGAGAVCTGTLLQGHIKIGDTVEFPELQTTKKIKSMQIFKQAVEEAFAGDRVALAIPGLDAKSLERGIISAPGLVPSATRMAVIDIIKIPYFKEAIASKKRYHISVGYSTVTALVQLFRIPETGSNKKPSPNGSGEEMPFTRDIEYEIVESLNHPTMSSQGSAENEKVSMPHFALLEFDKPVFILPHTIVVGSNLQLAEGTACRLAFHGPVIDSCQDKDYKKTYLPSLRLFKSKKKQGTVDRVLSSDTIIGKGFCQKQSNIDHLIGLNVTIRGENWVENEEVKGSIQSRFGQTNKLRISLNSPLSEAQINRIKAGVCFIDLLYKDYKYHEKSDTSRKLVQ